MTRPMPVSDPTTVTAPVEAPPPSGPASLPEPTPQGSPPPPPQQPQLPKAIPPPTPSKPIAPDSGVSQASKRVAVVRTAQERAAAISVARGRANGPPLRRTVRALPYQPFPNRDEMTSFAPHDLPRYVVSFPGMDSMEIEQQEFVGPVG